MTFYWWSHWFWITVCTLAIWSSSSSVEAYPSQPQPEQQQQQREQEKSALAAAAEPPLVTTTKLYQTTSSISWATVTATMAPSTTMLLPAVHSSNATTIITTTATPMQATQKQRSSKELTYKVPTQQLNANADVAVNAWRPANEMADKQNEYKRSADFVSTPAAKAADGGLATDTDVAADVDALNNYTNFSQVGSGANANETKSNDSSTTATQAKLSDSNGHNQTSTATATAPADGATLPPVSRPATPAAPRINTALDDISLEDASAGADDEADVVAAASAAAEAMQQPQQQAAVDVAPFTLENVNREDELRRAEIEHRSRKSKVLSADYKHINRYINYSSDSKSLLTRSASTAPNNEYVEAEESNISSEALAIQRTYFLDAGAISAICFTVFGICCTVGTIGIVLYRRRYLNKPQALSEPDSSVYIDDSTMRDNSDEMYSLDNDSFLNSLEAMTIQNYWTDTVKHTKL